MIADVLHFAFTVSDIERSIRWYTEVLGLELVHRQRQDNAYTRALVGVPDAVLEVAEFRVPGLMPKYSKSVLELIQYVRPPAGQVELRNTNVGVAHLALMVTDIEERYRRMKAHGAKFVSPPVRITEGINVGGFACYLEDPDEITLELLQPSDSVLNELGLTKGVGP